MAYRANRAACFQLEVQPKNRSWSVPERAELGQTSLSLESVRVLRLHITVSLPTEGAEPSFEMSVNCFYALHHLFSFAVLFEGKGNIILTYRFLSRSHLEQQVGKFCRVLSKEVIFQ